MSLDVTTLGLGDLVSYEDAANPRRHYIVRATPETATVGLPIASRILAAYDYRLEDVETGAPVYSDLRQSGWRLEVTR